MAIILLLLQKKTTLSINQQTKMTNWNWLEKNNSQEPSGPFSVTPELNKQLQTK